MAVAAAAEGGGGHYPRAPIYPLSLKLRRTEREGGREAGKGRASDATDGQTELLPSDSARKREGKKDN